MRARALSEIAKQFDVRIKRHWRIVNGVYRVELYNGKQFALKSMPYPLARLRWIDDALQEIRKAGFTRISWRNPTEPEGKQLYVRLKNGMPYVLTPWIQGRWPFPRSQEEMKTCGAMLAHFHQMGTISSARGSRMNMIGKWPTELRMKHAILEKQVCKSRQSRSTNRTRSFLQSRGDEILGYSQQAQSILQESEYRLACRLAEQRPYICHGDGGPSNFIFNSDGAYLIDFETMRVDLRAYDLYRVIYNSSKDYGWDFAIAQSILDGYQTISKLSALDLELVRVWLRFPRTTVLLLNKYFRSRAIQTRERIAARLPGALKAERRVTAFLKELNQYLD